MGAFLLFYFVPYLITILLPAIFIPKIISKRLKLKEINYSHLLPFILPLTILPILANLVWEITLYNHVYYEWDRIFLPYDFFFYERPLIDGSGSWIAKGWTQWHLFLIWLAITCFIYFIAFAIPQLVTKKTGKQNYLKVIRPSLLPFMVITCISLIIRAVKMVVLGY